MENQENNFKPFLCATYGTLKRGHGNHRVLGDSEFIGECISEPDYTMFSVSDWYPAVIFGGDDAIHMEVFKVDNQETSDRLDQLEGYPDMYIKGTVETPWGEATIYLYNYEVERLEQVETGNWVL